MLAAEEASPEDAEPVSSSSWTAVAMMGTLRQMKHTDYKPKLISKSLINDGLKIEQEKAMTHRLPCLSMTSRRSKGRIEARNKVFTGIRFYYLCLCPCLIWASTVTNSTKVVHFIEVSRLVTDRWFSLLGPKESLMSRCRWMARWGILSRGLETWTSRFTSLPPLWSKKYGVSIISKGHYIN